MPGKPSADMLRAMQLIREGIPPKQAAAQANMHITSIYRSPIYKAWRTAKTQKTSASPLRSRK